MSDNLSEVARSDNLAEVITSDNLSEVITSDNLDKDMEVVPATEDVEVESWEEEGNKVGNADERHEPVRRKGVGILQGGNGLSLVLLTFSA
jgi:hypothetical protein